MESSHPLKALLQLQLASDSYAVLHLPYVLDSLTSECLLPSPHTPKWTSRISSLIHSKDTGSRWAGLCIAYKTCLLSKPILIEFAQSWLGVALPMLSKNEPIPIIKSSVRLIRQLFSGATDIPEFQRQVATPNVPKFTNALASLAEKNLDMELTILVFTTLTRLIPLYPTLHRVQHSALSALSLKFLSGTAPQPTSISLMETASCLYSVLPLTGGKVGSISLWRKSMDDTLAFAWSAFLGLRSTFPNEDRAPASPTPPTDLLVSVPLSIDRLRCSIMILRDLLGSTNHRPVQVPIGSLVNFIGTLLSCIADEKIEGHADSAVRAMEISIIPSVWELACNLLVSLAKCARYNLTPALTRLVSYLTFHLENTLPSSQRLPFLQALQAVLANAHPLHNSLLSTRLTKALLPSLCAVLAAQSESHRSGYNSSKSKKGKKRVQGYEGDELFKVSREVICPTIEDGKVVLATLDVMRLLIHSPYLAPGVHSISSRILLSMLLAVSQVSPASLSPHLALHGQILGKVQMLCAVLAAGTTSVLSKSLGLVIGSVTAHSSEQIFLSGTLAQHEFDLLLHPRMPPLVRSLPHVESLALFRAEESQEEITVRESLALGVTSSDISSNLPEEVQDMNTEDPLPSIQHTATPAAPAPHENVQQTILPAYHGGSLMSERTLALPSSPHAQTLAVDPIPLLPQPASTLDDGEDEDDEMPIINMDSDSD